MAADKAGGGARGWPRPASRAGASGLNQLADVLKRTLADLKGVGADFAVVGGLAVSARSEPRFTRDIDYAVVVSSDQAAEGVVHSLLGRGYRLQTLLEQKRLGRIATVRLVSPHHQEVFVDLLFASSGIEREVVQGATPLRLVRGVTAKVASIGHLLAMKVLSVNKERKQDHADILQLLRFAGPSDLRTARAALRLIEKRRYHRGRSLRGKLERFIGEVQGR